MEYSEFAVRGIEDPGPSRRPSWPALEIRHLIAFQAVASAGSFVGAGNRLGYTQSGISAQIRAMEQLVGVRLIHRSRGARRIALTAEGAILLRYTNQIVAMLETAAQHLREA